MRKNVRYHYYVEGNCEKKLIDEFKKQQLPIIAGKIDVFNAIQGGTLILALFCLLEVMFSTCET